MMSVRTAMRYRWSNCIAPEPRALVSGFMFEIEIAPGGTPGRPEEEPGEVIEKITVHCSTPIDDRADTPAVDQDVVVQQVAVDEVALVGAIPEQSFEANEPFRKR